ncbi:MAG: TonB-dependent receptor [Acidobacteriota bacterium]|nr:TonB-dependent receptor [Acidobacteriota bacterium]
MKHVLAVIPTLFLIAVSALAEQQSQTQQPTVSEQIIVTASALPEEIDQTPVAATVITREDIERREARDVLDVLREVPGLGVSRTGSPGKNTTLFIRGGSTKQALVLWNGIEMNNAYFSGYDFGQLSSAGVEKVEIVRGPFSALYGSEAVSGVINVLTKPSATGVTVDVEGGENGLFNGMLYGAHVSDRWVLNGTVERRQDDGFANNDDFSGNSIVGGATMMPNKHFSAGVLARYSTYEDGVPFAPNGSSSAFVPSPHRREEGSQRSIAIPLIYQAARSVFELRLSDNRREDKFNDPEGAFGDEFSDVEASTRGARGTARANTSFGAITLGGEYERAEVDSANSFGGGIEARTRTNKSVFIEDRFSWTHGGQSSIEIAAGARYDDFGDFGSETSPRIAAAWVQRGHKIRASYGKGFRAPAIGELYFPFGGNVNLRSESSRNVEAGYDYYTPNGSFSATLFDADYEDLINFGPTFQFENIEAASSRGLEIGAQRRLGAVRVDLSYTWLDTKDEATGEELLRRPQHSGSIGFGYQGASYSTQFVIIHKGQRGDVTDLFPFGTVQNDAYTTADVTVHYRIGSLSPYVKLENLTDEKYEEVFGYASGRRRAIVGVRFTM